MDSEGHMRHFPSAFDRRRQWRVFHRAPARRGTTTSGRGEGPSPLAAMPEPPPGHSSGKGTWRYRPGPDCAMYHLVHRRRLGGCGGEWRWMRAVQSASSTWPQDCQGLGAGPERAPATPSQRTTAKREQQCTLREASDFAGSQPRRAKLPELLRRPRTWGRQRAKHWSRRQGGHWDQGD